MLYISAWGEAKNPGCYARKIMRYSTLNMDILQILDNDPHKFATFARGADPHSAAHKAGHAPDGRSQHRTRPWCQRSRLGRGVKVEDSRILVQQPCAIAHEEKEAQMQRPGGLHKVGSGTMGSAKAFASTISEGLSSTQAVCDAYRASRSPPSWQRPMPLPSTYALSRMAGEQPKLEAVDVRGRNRPVAACGTLPVPRELDGSRRRAGV